MVRSLIASAILLIVAFGYTGTALAEGPTLQELKLWEETLKQEYQTLTESGRTAQGSLEELSRLVTSLNLTEEEKSELRKFDARKAAGSPLAERLKPVFAFLKEREAQLEKFQDSYDKVLMGKLDYIGQRYLETSQGIVDEVLPTLNEQEKASLLAKLEKVRSDFKEYETGKSKALDRDLNRFRRYRDFQESFQALVLEAGKKNEGFRARWGRKWDSLKEKLPYLTMLPEGIVGTYKLMTGRTALADSVRSAFSRVARINGYDVTVKGKEKLNGEVPSNSIDVVMMNHAHGILDNVVLTDLGLRNTRIVADLNAAFYPWMRKAAQAHPDILTVGGETKNPVSVIANDLQAGTHRGMAIFAEGNVPSGIDYAARPFAKTFEKFFLVGLRDKGIGLRLIPLTSPGHYRLFHDLKAVGEEAIPKSISSQVHDPLAPEVTDILLSDSKSAVLSRMLRQLQIEENHQFGLGSNRFLGMPSVEETIGLVDGYVIKKTRCSVHLGNLIRKGSPTS